jgi:DnaJ-class molecular chaperone
MYTIECTTCSGSGQVLSHVKTDCYNCGGSGYDWTGRRCPAGCDPTGGTLAATHIKCSACDGTGKRTTYAMM